MKRFLVFALILGGAVVALMVASLLLGNLQKKARESAGGSGADIKDAVAGLRRALADWDYDDVTRRTSDVPAPVYQQMFVDAHGDNPDRLRRLRGVLASMDAFPSVRFPKITPERVDVNYEVADGTSLTRPTVSCVWKEDGLFLRTARFPIGSTDNTPGGAVVFREGDNISLDDATEKLFNSLTGTRIDDFLTLMMLDNAPAADAAKQLDNVRAQVMTCHADRLKLMLPRIERLPRGTRWLQVLVVADVEQKKLWLDIEVVPGAPVRFRHFRAGLAEKPERRVTQPVKTPSGENETR